MSKLIIENTTDLLNEECLDLVREVVKKGLFHREGKPDHYCPVTVFDYVVSGSGVGFRPIKKRQVRVKAICDEECNHHFLIYEAAQ